MTPLKILHKSLLFLLFASALTAQEVGTSALSGEKAGKASEWQTWTFAGSALVTAALGVFFVSLHEGQGSTSH